jgi:hypothetical protein
MVFSLRAFSFHSLFDRPEEGAWILKAGLSWERVERYLPNSGPDARAERPDAEPRSEGNRLATKPRE